MSESNNSIKSRRQAAQLENSDQYQSKRAELLEIAAEVFNEKGYEAATLSEIAERFGTVRASLYYYVESKEELFRETILGVLDANIEQAEALLESDMDTREKLVSLIELLMFSYEENYPHMFLYIQEGMQRIDADDTPWGREMASKTRRFESVVISIIRGGVEDGAFREDIRPTLAANALFGMLNWTHRWFVPGGEVDATEMSYAFAAIFLEGFSEND